MSVQLILIELSLLTLTDEIVKMRISVNANAVGTWTELRASEDPCSFFPQNILQQWRSQWGPRAGPWHSSSKQGPTVALTSVSSNLHAPQRRQNNWLASRARYSLIGWRVVGGQACLVDRSCQGKFGDKPARLGKWKCKHNFCVKTDINPLDWDADSHTCLDTKIKVNALITCSPIWLWGL